MENRTKTILKPFEADAAYFNERVASGIEKNRKGWAKIQLIDSEGNPISDVHVHATQKTHEFKYGANLFMLDELESEEKNAAYRELFADAFNFATLPFYWCDLEPEQGKPRYAKESPRIYRRPTPDLCLEYCEKKGITPKAHCLDYEQWTPLWVPENVDSVKYYLDKRMAELSERYAGRIHGWEVTNETLCEEYHRYAENRYTSPFFREPDLVEWNFACARRHFPLNELIINEASGNIWSNFKYNRSAYYMQIERALQSGASIDTIGMQFHMFFRAEEEAEKTQPYYSPRNLYAVLDQYAQLDKALQITEVTLPAYTESSEDEELQAELLRRLYSIWFSSDGMEAIVYWNLVDGYAAFAPQGKMDVGENYYRGGLVRFDFTPKPAYYALRDLFTKTWHTEVDAHADETGTVSFKGFYGTYDLTITAKGKTFSLPFALTKNSRAERHILLP